MNVKPIIEELANKWKIIALATIVTTIIFSLYYYYNPILYKSTVSFLVDDEATRKNDQNLDDQSIYIAEHNPNAFRLYQLAKSTEMFDYLIKKFDLYKEYNINSTGPMHYEIMTNMLKENIDVTPVISGGMSITVKGLNKNLVADMANELFAKLEEMVKD